jgi:acyl transferase domain-containing protein/NADPH:quinone reductase-like Zn-dependent oxidoreductase
MGRELVFICPEFTRSLIQSDQILRELGASWSLTEELLRDEASSRINRSEIAQPASTALQIALVGLILSMGVRPMMLLGHSSGEIAAAYAAGILTHRAALKVSYCRSFVSNFCREATSTKGAMLSVGLSEREIAPLLAQTKTGVVSVACLNSPTNTTVSGDDSAVQEVQKMLNQRNVFNRRLKVDTAYHSHHMRLVANEYLRSLGTIETQPRRETVRFMSSVTAEEKFSDFGAAYWVENLVSKVRFCDALEEYCRMRLERSATRPTTDVFIEIGPHSVLAGPIRQTITQKCPSFNYACLPSLVRGRNAMATILELVGKMFEHGFPVDVAATHSLIAHPRRELRVLTDLPPYPWDHSNTYWYQSRLSREYRLRQHPYHDLLGARLPGSTSLEPIWRHTIGVESLPWLAEHIVDGLIIFPGAGYICMAIEAIRQVRGSQPSLGISKIALRGISFLKALVVPAAPSKVEMQLSLRTPTNAVDSFLEFRVYALSQDDVWHEHCRGLIKAESDSTAEEQTFLGTDTMFTRGLLDSLATEARQKLRPENIYQQLRANGNVYGPRFAAIEELNMNDTRAIGHIVIPDVRSIMPAKSMQPHIIHPTTLDALMHSVLPIYAQNRRSGAVMPVSMDEITVSPDIADTPGHRLLAGVFLALGRGRSSTADLFVFNGETNSQQQVPVLTVSQVEFRALGAAQETEMDDSSVIREMSYTMEWGADVDLFPLEPAESLKRLSVQDYFKHLCFKYSQMTILQVNSGIGNATLPILQAMSQAKSSIRRYHFTDPSRDCLKEARDRLHQWLPLIHFETLDVKQDPGRQGFKESSYDVIITTQLPEERDLVATLTHLRMLLKPGGRLIFLPGNPYPSDLSRDLMYDSLLRRCSFNGIEIAVREKDGLLKDTTTTVSKAIVPDRHTSTPPVEIIAEHGPEEPFVADLAAVLGDQDFEVSVTKWSAGIVPRSSAVYVVVDDARNPLLVNPTRERFGQITKLISGASNILWMTVTSHHSSPPSSSSPPARNAQHGLVTGLARSARAEHENLKLITLDVQDRIQTFSAGLGTVIQNILRVSFGVDSTPLDNCHEDEYVYRDGRVLIPRLMPSARINNWLARAAGKPTVERTTYGDPQRPLKLGVVKPDSMECFFVNDTSIHGPLDLSEVEINVRAHALTSDLIAKPGHEQDRSSSTDVYQFAGIVTRVGSSPDLGLEVGDRVCAWVHGGPAYASSYRVNVRNVFLLPDSVPLTVGAAMPFVCMTAYHCLIEIADLQQGQMVLVHRASTDIGRALLSIAHRLGAIVFATVSNTAEREALIERFKMSPSYILPEKPPLNLKHRIFQLTEGKGFDVVVHPSSGVVADPAADRYSGYLAELGIYIQVGGNTLNKQTWHQIGMPAVPLDKSATVISFELATFIRRRPRKAATLLGQAMTFLLEAGSMVPNMDDVLTMPIAAIEGAAKMVQSRRFNGTVVLEVDRSPPVKTLITRPVEWQLDASGSYVIAGGLGDLGRRICDLMARRGAKHVIILSRRDLSPERRQSLQDELGSMSAGLTIHNIACDIASSTVIHDLRRRIEDLGVPPIKGIAQAAVVLQVRSCMVATYINRLTLEQ